MPGGIGVSNFAFLPSTYTALPGAAQGLGMTLVELGVGTTVSSVMITLFREFAES